MGVVKYIIFIVNLLIFVSHLAKNLIFYLRIVVNALQIGGTGVLVLGVILAVQPSGQDTSHNWAIVILIVFGACTALISFFGCCGAIVESPCMLITVNIIK